MHLYFKFKRILELDFGAEFNSKSLKILLLFYNQYVYLEKCNK